MSGQEERDTAGRDKPADLKTATAVKGTPAAARTAAVIEIGTTAARLAIAQIEDRNVRILESLQQSVALGKDAFTTGVIGRTSTEECVRALKSFSRVLGEYGITQPDQLRVVATTAVREANNRDVFVDRIYIATGLQVQILDEADVVRLTYASVRQLIRADRSIQAGKSVVVEVGCGSTEFLLIDGSKVLFSRAYRLGSLRMRQALDNFTAPVAHRRDVMDNQIKRIVEQIEQSVEVAGTVNMIAIGSDTRFAASQIIPEWKPDEPARIPIGDLKKLTDRILALSVVQIERKYHIPFPDAETLGPGLLVYLAVAQLFGMSEIIVTSLTMRHGVFNEMIDGGVLTESLVDKIVWSALEVVRKFRGDQKHARQVTRLSRALFGSLRDEHRLKPRDELLLTVAAVLHDTGLFISENNHHKHSMYLIQNSEVFGMNRQDMMLVSLIARYHRKAEPKPSHAEYMAIDREDRLMVAKLAAILRVADALDVSHLQRINDVTCRHEKDSFVIAVKGVDDLSLEELAMKQKGTMFEDIYGVGVDLRADRE